MEENFIENMLDERVKAIVSEKIDDEIKEKVNNFKNELEHRKNYYISEVMKGIKIYHENDMGSLGINYKIIFENIYKAERNDTL